MRVPSSGRQKVRKFAQSVVREVVTPLPTSGGSVTGRVTENEAEVPGFLASEGDDLVSVSVGAVRLAQGDTSRGCELEPRQDDPVRSLGCVEAAE